MSPKMTFFSSPFIIASEFPIFFLFSRDTIERAVKIK